MPLRGASRPPRPELRPGYRAVGRVARPWGLRGHIKVAPLTDFPERFDVGARVYVRGVPRRIQQVRWQNHGVYLLLEGVDSPEMAETLRGVLVEVPEEERPAFGPGEYYIDDLEGCTVRDQEGGEIGVITEVLQPGANDVFVVQRPGKADLLVPAIASVVTAVDIAAQVVVVDIPPGLDPEESPAASARGNARSRAVQAD